MNDQPREEQVAVRTYGTRYWCTREGCGGILKFTGTALMSNPAKYVHLCIKCGKQYDTPRVAGSTSTEFVQ